MFKKASLAVTLCITFSIALPVNDCLSTRGQPIPRSSMQRAVAPPPPNIPPPAFARWTVNDAVKAFNKFGLLFHVRQPGHSSLLSFDFIENAGLDSAVSDGFIQSFSTESSLIKAARKYIEMNESGIHTWSFVQDNLLLVLTGETPEKRARTYEKALYSLGN